MYSLQLLYSRKVSPIWPPALMDEKFFVLCYDYIKDMATFTALAKVYSTEYFCNTKVAGVGKIFVQQKFSAIW